MYPHFTIKGMTFNSYGLMLSIGFIFSLTFCIFRFYRKKADLKLLMTLLSLVIISGFVGSHLLSCIIESGNLSVFWTLLKDFKKGYVFYGGLTAIFITTFIYCKINAIDYLYYADLIIPTISGAQGFGRIGCFLAGCCYGRPCSFLPVVFTRSEIAPNGIALFPVQLLCSCFDFILMFFLLFLEKKQPRKGTVTFTYLIIYSILRFIVEFFRGDSRRGFILFFSTSQVISLGILLFSSLCILYRRHFNIGKLAD